MTDSETAILAVQATRIEISRAGLLWSHIAQAGGGFRMNRGIRRPHTITVSDG